MVDDEATMELLRLAGRGEREALDQLLDRHRDRLRQMIAVRMDRRLSARVDPSDIVQETFVEAARKLPEYAGELRSPFYLWLRQLAWRRLLDLSRKHISAGCRSVENQAEQGPLTEESAMQLAARLVASQTSPSQHVQRKELRSRVRAALTRLEPSDQEVLVLRYLEELSAREIASILGITERAVRYRQRVAMERFAGLLGHVSQ
jgi:RNA polymerase sigma-70 factor (ECF subfamily)